MKTLSKIVSFICVCMLATGCVVDAPELPQEDNPPVGCSGPNDSCEGGQICALVDPCGSPCADDGPELPCAAICIEEYACVTPLDIADACDPMLNHCGDGLACQIDESAGCGPSDCREEGCLDCPPIFTCQPTVAPSTCEELRCGPGCRSRGRPNLPLS